MNAEDLLAAILIVLLYLSGLLWTTIGIILAVLAVFLLIRSALKLLDFLVFHPSRKDSPPTTWED